MPGANLAFHRLAPDPGAGRALGPDTPRLPMSDGSGVVVVEAWPALDGERLTEASAAFDPDTGAPVVHFSFGTKGAVVFGKLTQALVGQPPATVLDGEVPSAPVMREAILGGSGGISGDFTVEETVTLSAPRRAGALPVPLEVIDERTVGADPGADAVARGLWTWLAGFALVATVMILLYGGRGIVATAAPLLNVALTIVALALLGAMLTLPRHQPGPDPAELK